MTLSSDLVLVEHLLNIVSFSPLNVVKATQLIERYTSIEAILFAPAEELETTYGLTSLHIQHFRCIRAILLRSQEKKLHTFETFDTAPYLDFIKLNLAHRSIEGVFVVLLSSQKKFIHSDLLSLGSETSAVFPLNTLVKLALEHNARYVVLAHNHPTGSIRPSHQDIAMTAQLRRTLLALNISLIDHVIVSHTNVFSILSNKLIVRLSNPEPSE